jgi:hypothetical protein
MPTTETSTPASSTVSGGWDWRYRNWTRTPNYISVPKDSLPINPYLDSRKRASQLFFEGQRTVDINGTVSWNLLPQYLYNFNQIATWDNALIVSAGIGAKYDAAVNEAMVQALTKASDSKINLAVALAEGRKTVEMLMENATRLFNAYRFFRKGKLKEVYNLLNIDPRKGHKSWLEMKYGWMPLLSDVKGAAEFFAQRHVGRPLRFTVVGKATRDLSYVDNHTITGYGGASLLHSQSCFGSIEVKVKAWLEVINPNLSTAQQLGLTNPMLIAWEVVPFSFVFDWFISVGNYLGALTALHGLNVRRSMLSAKFIINTESSYPASTFTSAGTTFISGGETLKLHREEYQRAPTLIEPWTLYPPRKEHPLDITKVITSLALFRQLSR